LGEAMNAGARACFAAVNEKGGVHGRPIELVSADDGYDVKRAVANVDGFCADANTFALFNCMGTPMIAAALPRVAQARLPFFAPFSGGLAARPAGMRNVFPIRASYPEEAQRLVQHLATVGIRRIGIAWQANAFGQEVLDGARAAMQRYKLDSDLAISVKNDGADADTAAKRLLQADPQAVLVALAGQPAMQFIKAMRASRRGLSLYALSVMGSAATIRALGNDAIGITITQVVPSPTSTVIPVVRDFQQARKSRKDLLEPSHLELEGYINARAFVEALRRAGRNATPASFIESTWSVGRVDLGGFEVNFVEPGKGASTFVELTMIGRDGRFVR
jgi:ABC-type branched-subunit amino acid transport system substrate-binding protein